MIPAQPGTINGYVKSWCLVDGVPHIFNGTTLGLAIVSVRNGAVAGNIVRADYGAGFRSYRITEESLDTRPGGIGFFAERE